MSRTPWGDPYRDDADLKAKVHFELESLLEEHGKSAMVAAILEVAAYIVSYGDATAEKNIAYRDGLADGKKQAYAAIAKLAEESKK